MIQLFNQVFQLKTLVIKMMSISGRSRGWAGVNISFLEHNSATIKTILMVHGRIIKQVSGKCCMQE